MTKAGVRDLKARLSEYLRKVKTGETVQVTDRGETVALLIPPSSKQARPGFLEEMAREGLLILGKGGPPRGSVKPIRIRKGKPVSEIVIEDRG